MVAHRRDRRHHRTDAKVASFAYEKGKGIVIALNKWDLTEPGPKASQRLHDEIERKLTYLSYAPIVTVSARSGAHVDRLMKTTGAVAAARKKRIPTGKLNRFFRDVIERHPPPTQSVRLVKLYYMTQAPTRPPVFFGDRKTTRSRSTSRTSGTS